MRFVKGFTQVLVVFAVLVNFAFAATLEEAKASGLIGEKQDGYIGLVQTNAPADVVALVADVNAQRRQRYEQIARENGIDVGQVAKLAFTRAFETTLPGNFVESAPGQWTRKQ